MSAVNDRRTVQILAPDGTRVDDPEFAFHGDVTTVQSLYRDMALVRRIDTEATALQRHGELGLWPPSLGQEAAQVGSARALAPQDWAFPTYREHGLFWCRGVRPVDTLGVFRGTTMGGWSPGDHNVALPAIVIGAQTLHAAGYAMGLTLDGAIGLDDTERDTAVLAYLGDGATSQGDVHESCVFAASFGAPLVYFCQNNHWAISVPTQRQSRSPLVDRAQGYGMRGIQVDGNDVLACLAVSDWALDHARNGHGPVFVESLTYRMGAHTTSDDPTRYRSADELETWERRDPIARVRLYLESRDVGAGFFDDIDAEADDLGADLRAECRKLPEPDLAALFERVTLAEDPELMRQRDEVLSWRESA